MTSRPVAEEAGARDATSWATTPGSRRSMQGNQAGRTAPELALRRALHAQGFRFRVAHPVPGLPRRTIDIAFTRLRLAVFVDGCFWHGCPEHGTRPQANADYWGHKLNRNATRDAETTRALEDGGWHVLRLWEHETLENMVAQNLTAMARARLRDDRS